MEGVTIYKDDEYCVFYVEYFSEELKNAIKDNLSAICHGEADSQSGKPLYNYKKTLAELIERYKAKNKDKQIGLIGELLVHVLIRTELLDFSIDSPYFNMEERSVKKGFDIVIDNSKSETLWIAEVKSGNIHQKKTSTQTIVELINTAKNDLRNRLNNNNNNTRRLWLNAIHGAKLVLDHIPDKKRAIVSILEDNAENSNSSSINVILVGSLFHDITDKFDQVNVFEKKKRIDNESIFNDVFVIAIQKHTHDTIYEFLKSESGDDE